MVGIAVIPAEISGSARSLSDFVATDARGVRQVLVARYGLELGTDLYGEVLEYATANWERLAGMENPAGYLVRVARTKARRYWRWRRRIDLPAVESAREPTVEPGLPGALAELPERQRAAVVLVHAHGHSYAEAGALLGVPESTIRNDVHRGLLRLRASLGVER